MLGKIIKNISNKYIVLANDDEYDCICMGKIRLDKKPKVGDEVEFEKYDDVYAIEKIYDRTNELIRPPIANIDQAIVVCSAEEPRFSTTLVDRLIFWCQYADIDPIICITKMDLIKDDDIIYEYIKDYQKSGYVVVTSNKNELNNDIVEILKNKTSIFVGQSGVGKSTLLNLIEPSLNLDTQRISKALNRGKHTTRHTQLYRLKGGLIGDAPGFSSLDFSFMDPMILQSKIKDFKPYLGSCYYNDCKHINEPNCGVKKAVDEGLISKIRYENYLKVLELIKENKR